MARKLNPLWKKSCLERKDIETMPFDSSGHKHALKTWKSSVNRIQNFSSTLISGLGTMKWCLSQGWFTWDATNAWMRQWPLSLQLSQYRSRGRRVERALCSGATGAWILALPHLTATPHKRSNRCVAWVFSFRKWERTYNNNDLMGFYND